MSMKNREQETDLVKLMNRSNKMADAAIIIALSAILIAFLSFMISL